MGVIFLQAKTGEQSLEVRNLKKEALKYAGETFEGHREQAFAALRFFPNAFVSPGSTGSWHWMP